MKLLILKKLLNFGAIFGRHLVNENVSWVPKVKERLSEIAKQEDIRISVENVKIAMRKIANWKTPGSDCAQDHWFKRFSRWHSRLTEHLQTCIVVGDVPTWMTKGKKSLIQKDSENGNAANSYCPITCLPLMWKVLTSVLREKVYTHLSDKNALPDEQKECREDSRETKGQLLTHK